MKREDIIKLSEQNRMLRAALQGCRFLAETEAANGSKAWSKAIPLIDEALNYRPDVQSERP